MGATREVVAVREESGGRRGARGARDGAQGIPRGRRRLQSCPHRNRTSWAGSGGSGGLLSPARGWGCSPASPASRKWSRRPPRSPVGWGPRPRRSRRLRLLIVCEQLLIRTWRRARSGAATAPQGGMRGAGGPLSGLQSELQTELQSGLQSAAATGMRPVARGGPSRGVPAAWTHHRRRRRRHRPPPHRPSRHRPWRRQAATAGCRS